MNATNGTAYREAIIKRLSTSNFSWCWFPAIYRKKNFLRTAALKKENASCSYFLNSSYKALFPIFCVSFSNCGTSLHKNSSSILLISSVSTFSYYERENPFFNLQSKSPPSKKDLFFSFLSEKREIKLKKFRARQKLLFFIISFLFFVKYFHKRRKLNTLDGEKGGKILLLNFWCPLFTHLIFFCSFLSWLRPALKMVQSRPTRSLILNWDLSHRTASYIRMQFSEFYIVREKIGKFSPHLSYRLLFLFFWLIYSNIHVVLKNERELLWKLARSIL